MKWLGLRRLRNRRAALGGALAVLAACAVALGIGFTDGDGREPRFDGRQLRLVHRASDFWSGVSLAHPARFGFHQYDRFTGRVTVAALVVSNFDPNLVRPPGWFDMPRNGVAFFVWEKTGDPTPRTEIPEAHFPVSTRKFWRYSYRTRSGTHVRVLWHRFGANGYDLTAELRFGEDADEDDRPAMRKVAASLRFAPLKRGDCTGYGFRVLGYPSEYRAHSVTPVGPGTGAARDCSSPFFLIRAPGGFYALERRPDGREGECTVTFDRPRFQFYCPENGARWDRMGKTLRHPNPRRHRYSDLPLLDTKLAHDGHLLAGGSRTFAGESGLERKFW